MLITAAGKIGAGKSALTAMLADVLDTQAIYEPIEDNPLLEKFYEDKDTYGFVFQIDMISRRFELIQQALLQNNSVLDRSILEDSIFLDQLYLENHVNKFEHNAYHKLLDRMMKELDELPKKRPDLLVYIDVPFEKEIERINKRAREFEKVSEGTELWDYFSMHSKMYDQWIKDFNECPVITIDAMKYDYVENEADRIEVLEDIVAKLVTIGSLSFKEATLAYCKINNAAPTIVAITLYNKIQKLLDGKYEYHNLANLYDLDIQTIDSLQELIRKENEGNKCSITSNT